MKEAESNFDEKLEKSVQEIHDLIETPHDLIRKYLKYTKGNKEKAIDLILNNFIIPLEEKKEEKEEKKETSTKKKDESLLGPIRKQLSQVEDELIKQQSLFDELIGSSNESFFESGDMKSIHLQQEKSFIEKSLKEAKESKNVQFFCKGEKEALLGSSIQRWKFVPTVS